MKTQDKYPLQMFKESEFYSLDPETRLHIRVADYLCLEYPDTMFHSDYGSGARLKPKQYKIQSAQNGCRKSWPDMFIAHTTPTVLGLYVELKPEGTRLLAVHCKPNDPRRSLDGQVYATTHLREQADVLHELRKRGYMAEFGVGLEATKNIIDNYLGEKK